MRSLRREISVPTLLLTIVVGAALAYVGWDSARHARALERDADEVRAATALALALTDAAHEEEHWIASLTSRPELVDGMRLSEIREHVARLSTEIHAFPLSPRAAEVWRQYGDARAALRPMAEEVVLAARSRDPLAMAIGLDKWFLMTDRTNRLLRNFTAYHLSRLDRTVADLQHRRTRALLAAGAAVFAGLLLANGFAAMLARTVVRPIVEMATAAKRIQATGAASPVAGAERHDEIGVLARAFNDMTDRLVSTNASLAEAVRARDEFISVASHELKTPLTPLALRVQQVVRAVSDASTRGAPLDKAVSAARDLDRHVSRLSKLVENLLDVSSINSGQLALRIEEVSLREAVDAALDRIGAELAQAGCDVRVDGAADVTVSADRSRIEQVLVNLLGNSAKYAPGGPVVVSLAHRDETAELYVTDAGPGITPDDQARIFERFERAVPDRHVSGLGLGLYIAREIVHAHGGELLVQSEPGTGATFIVRLPACSRKTGAAL